MSPPRSHRDRRRAPWDLAAATAVGALSMLAGVLVGVRIGVRIGRRR